ncbi:hypothetical protein HN748_02250 [Candidatus Peregrinibacteria bacterium]|jgi:hypothetical protein|nr:hypothetical protein [Candidatus Peregrinibacteria bacterium]MBT7483780.1 hypothetical protein [Candidatus Peregrinibacteria bacterium]MBT7703030.1 hypothetical protein [Candidatus Peregrinibacteria bacterium]
MTDLLIIFVGIIVLLTLGTSWVWNNLVRQVKEFKNLQNDLRETLAHRQDTIPYLVESYRNVEAQANNQLDQVVLQRAVVREERDFEESFRKERALTEQLQDLFEGTRNNARLQKDIGWLEARTEIQKIGEAVTEHTQKYKDLRLYISDKLTTFPYVIFKTAVEKRI